MGYISFLFFCTVSLFLGQPSVHADPVKLNLPVGCIPYEDDASTDGPRAAARVMEHMHRENGYGPLLSSSQDYDRFKNQCPKSLNGFLGLNAIGPSMSVLVDYMNARSPQIRYEKVTSPKVVEMAIENLHQGRPVIALVKRGEFTLRSQITDEMVSKANWWSLGAFQRILSAFQSVLEYPLPMPRYIVINGYNDQTQVFYYIDRTGEEYEMSYSELASKWNWQIPAELESQIKSLSSVAVRFFPQLENLTSLIGATGNTMIEVDPKSPAVGLPRSEL